VFTKGRTSHRWEKGRDDRYPSNLKMKKSRNMMEPSHKGPERLQKGGQWKKSHVLGAFLGERRIKGKKGQKGKDKLLQMFFCARGLGGKGVLTVQKIHRRKETTGGEV